MANAVVRREQFKLIQHRRVTKSTREDRAMCLIMLIHFHKRKVPSKLCCNIIDECGGDQQKFLSHFFFQTELVEKANVKSCERVRPVKFIFPKRADVTKNCRRVLASKANF